MTVHSVSTESGPRSECHQPGMEVISPLVFLDSAQLDSSENLTELDEYLPIIGDDYFLPKEQSDDYIELPILHELGTDHYIEKFFNFVFLFCPLYNVDMKYLEIVRLELSLPGTLQPTRTPS